MKKLIPLLVILPLLLSGCEKKEDVRYKIKRAQLSSVQYTVKKLIRNTDKSWQVLGDKKILFSCKATVKVGVDMGKLSDDDIAIKGDNIKLTLPEPEVMAFNMQPDDIKVAYTHVTGWRSNYSNKERERILQFGEQEIRQDTVLTGTMVREAEQNAREFFELMLMQNGFKNIDINFKKQ